MAVRSIIILLTLITVARAQIHSFSSFTPTSGNHQDVLHKQTTSQAKPATKVIPFSRNPSTVSIRPQPYNVLRIEADHMSPVPRPNVYFNKAQHANGESQLTCPHEDDMKRSKLVKQLSCSHQDLDSEESMKHRPTRHNFYNTNQEASHMHWDDGKHPRWEGFIPVYVPTSKFRSLNEMRALPGFWMANENKPNFSMKPKTKLQINKDHGIQKKSALPDREEKGPPSG